MLVILYTCLYQYTDVGKFFCNFVQAVEASVRLRKYSIKTKGEVNSPHFLRFHFPVPQPSILMSFDIVTGTVEMESESDSAKSSAMMRASGPLGSLQSDSALRTVETEPEFDSASKLQSDCEYNIKTTGVVNSPHFLWFHFLHLSHNY